MRTRSHAMPNRRDGKCRDTLLRRVVPFVSACRYQEISRRSEKKKHLPKNGQIKSCPCQMNGWTKISKINTQHMSLVATSHLKPQPLCFPISCPELPLKATFYKQIIDIFLGKKLHPRDQSSLSHEFAHGICVLETLPEWATPQISRPSCFNGDMVLWWGSLLGKLDIVGPYLYCDVGIWQCLHAMYAFAGVHLGWTCLAKVEHNGISSI